jgi:hypothetical protein
MCEGRSGGIGAPPAASSGADAIPPDGDVARLGVDAGSARLGVDAGSLSEGSAAPDGGESALAVDSEEIETKAAAPSAMAETWRAPCVMATSLLAFTCLRQRRTDQVNAESDRAVPRHAVEAVGDRESNETEHGKAADSPSPDRIALRKSKAPRRLAERLSQRQK